jgi:pimeloyl-ACP methyl ester carboxylesterase
MRTITRCSNPAGRARAGILGLLVVLALSAVSWGAACGNKAGGVGGGRLFYRLDGSGRPLVIIDVGVGETFRTWTSMVAEIAKTTSVLVYDRAGYGESREGPYPRDGAREAAELSALLQAERIGGPYILVGHSLGGLNMQVFAAEHPSGVAGLLLLDPPPRGWLAGPAFPKLRVMFSGAAADLERAARAPRSRKTPANAAGRPTCGRSLRSIPRCSGLPPGGSWPSGLSEGCP